MKCEENKEETTDQIKLFICFIFFLISFDLKVVQHSSVHFYYTFYHAYIC